MRALRWIAGAAVVAVLGLGGATRAAAEAEEEEAPKKSTWEQLEADEAKLKAQWQRIHAKRKRALDEAQAKLDAAQAGRRKASDGGFQGVSRSEYREREQEAKTELEEARKALDALPGDARRAGVPPGFIRQLE